MRSDFSIVDYDHLGMVGSYFYILKNGESWTLKQNEDFSKKTQDEAEQETVKIVAKNLNKLNIQNESFLKLVYNAKEINQIQSIISNVSENWIRENNTLDWSNDESTSRIQVIMNSFEIGDTVLTLSGSAMSDIGISISVKNFYYDKYHNELNILEQGYTKCSLYGERDKNITYKTIDEVLNELSIPESEKKANTNIDEEKNAFSSDDVFRKSIINTWLRMTNEGDGSEKTFNYTFNADGTGTYSVSDHIIASFTYTISNISQNGTHGTITCQNEKFNKVLAVDLTKIQSGGILINNEEFRLNVTR